MSQFINGVETPFVLYIDRFVNCRLGNLFFERIGKLVTSWVLFVRVILSYFFKSRSKGFCGETHTDPLVLCRVFLVPTPGHTTESVKL